jgi:hypothetical protein
MINWRIVWAWSTVPFHFRWFLFYGSDQNPSKIALKFQIIFFASFALIDNVIIFYSILHKIFGTDREKFIMFYVFATGMVSTALMKLTLIIHSSVSCMDEIEATPSIINKIFNSYQDLKLCDILKMFSRQISLRSRVIKSAFFVVDWTLMYSVRYL